jgi:hypothetical protein
VHGLGFGTNEGISTSIQNPRSQRVIQRCSSSLCSIKQPYTLCGASMSQSADSQGWEGLKNVMRTLYIAKGYPLEGAEGVIELMEIRRGFKAT